MADDMQDVAKVLAQAGGGRARRWRLLMVLGVLLALGVGWLLLAGGGDPVRYTTEAATRGTITVKVTATGTVQPTTQVEISSELSGTLASVEVDYNSEIAVGQVLARLDATKLQAQVANAEASLAGARAGLAQARATAREAAADLARAQELDKRGIRSQTDLETAEAVDERARAAVESAEASLTLAEANLALQRADLEKAVIRSPIKGIVLDRAAEPGQIVASSLSAPVLFTLAEDLGRMDLQVDIDEADIGHVAVGNPAEFTVEAYQGRRFPAEIVQLRYAPQDTDGVVTYTGVLRVDNSAGLLRPGMTATAEIVVQQVADVLTVPNAALRYSPPQTEAAESGGSRGGSGLLGMLMPRRGPEMVAAQTGSPRVWLLRDGAPVEVPVVTGPSDGQRTAITEGALAEGDAVITDQSAAD